jgi:hypothetical protein
LGRRLIRRRPRISTAGSRRDFASGTLDKHNLDLIKVFQRLEASAGGFSFLQNTRALFEWSRPAPSYWRSPANDDKKRATPQTSMLTSVVAAYPDIPAMRQARAGL